MTDKKVINASGRSGLAEDPRFDTPAGRAANATERILLMVEIIKERPTVEWLQRLDANDVPSAPVLRRNEVIANEYRTLQGIFGAGLIPLSQATLLQINPPERHGQAMAVFGIGTILGPICGPVLRGWLTYDYNWRWVFYINLPVGVIAGIGALNFMRETRHAHREPFDFVGFATFSLAIGALQMLLDRGELQDWFGSTEIWIEATISGVALYLFTSTRRPRLTGRSSTAIC